MEREGEMSFEGFKLPPVMDRNPPMSARQMVEGGGGVFRQHAQTQSCLGGVGVVGMLWLSDRAHLEERDSPMKISFRLRTGRR